MNQKGSVSVVVIGLIVIVIAVVGYVVFKKDAPSSAKDIHSIDLAQALNPVDCEGQSFYAFGTAYYDFDGDGNDEALVIASSCMSGTAGNDIENVYRLNDSGKVEVIPMEKIASTTLAPFYAANGNSLTLQYSIKEGQLVATAFSKWADLKQDFFYTYQNDTFVIDKKGELIKQQNTEGF